MVLAPFDLLTPDFKNVATGQLCLHTLSHKCTPSSHKKWGLETNLCLIDLLYCWRSRPFSGLFEIARDAKMFTHVSRGPENDISEIWSSRPYRKKVFPNGLSFGQSPSEVLPARPNGSECGGKTVFEIGRSYRPEI